MIIEVLGKEYDLPESLIKVLRINKVMKDMKSGDIYKSIVVMDETSVKVVNKWLNTMKWDINVRQDSYSKVKEYQAEAQMKKMALTKELRNVERFLIDVYKKVDNREFRGVATPLIAFDKYDFHGIYLIVGSNFMRKYMKEVYIDESTTNK